MSNDALPITKTLLPTHMPITNKKCSLNAEDMMKEDCELILFELPKGFDKAKLKAMKIKRFRADGKEISLTDQYKGECYDTKHPIPNQVLTMIPQGKEDGRVFFKPVDRYIKVVEALDLLIPTEEAIIPRRLRLKKHKEAMKDKKKSK